MLFECFILDCCAVIAAKVGKICASSIQMNCTHNNKTVLPPRLPLLEKTKQKRCAFYYWQFCVKTDFFVFSFFLNLQFVYGLKRKNEIELLSPLCCVFLYYIYIYIFFFRIWLLLKIPWFWTAAVFLCCVRGPSALPSSFPDRGMSEERAEWSWHSLIPAD